MKSWVKDALGVVAGATTIMTAIANIVLFGKGDTIDLWVLLYSVLLVIGWEVAKDNIKALYRHTMAENCGISKVDEDELNDDFEIMEAEVIDEER